MKSIRTLGLAVVALLALASFGASSAAASSFIANGDPFYASVSGTSVGNQRVEIAGGLSECAGENLSGEMVQGGESFVPKTSEPSSCPFGYKVQSLNGCSIIPHPGAERSPGVFGGSFEIGPPGCGPITVNMSPVCKASALIYPKTGLAASYINQGSGASATVLMVAEATNLKYSTCLKGVQEDGHWSGQWTLQAARGSQPVSFAVQSEAPVGIGIGTSKGLPVFEADQYPVNLHIASTSTAKTSWHIVGANLTCATQYNASLSAAASEVAIAPGYSGCKLGTLPETVQMNGCQYALKLTHEGGGTNQLVCPIGKVVEMFTYASAKALEENKVSCTATIASQGLGTLTLGYIPGLIAANTAASGLTYTWSGSSGICPKSGVYTDGQYSYEAQLAGSH